MNLTNSTVLVTGANRGLGLVLVHALLARGASKVYAGMRRPFDLGVPHVVSVPLDVTDPASIMAAVSACGDTTLLINNAGIARLMGSVIEQGAIDMAHELMETNYLGLVRMTQAFAPVIASNGGGAVVNVLSDASWFARPVLAAYSASKSAAWSFTNAARAELRESGIQVLALHVGFMDTDMTKGLELQKASPLDVAEQTLDALEQGGEEVLADEGTRAIKKSLSHAQSPYLNPTAMA